MAAAAAGGGVTERWQMRLHRQTHKHAVMRMKEMMKAVSYTHLTLPTILRV